MTLDLEWVPCDMAESHDTEPRTPAEVDSLTVGHITRHYREVLTPLLHLYPDDVPLNIIEDIHLSDSGDLECITEVWISTPPENPQSAFYWHIPKINGNLKVVALKVDPNQQVVDAKIVDARHEGVYKIELRYRPAPPGDITRLRFSVLIIGSTKLLRQRFPANIFTSAYTYPFALEFADSVHSYEMRLHVPQDVSFTPGDDFDSSFDEMTQVRLSTETVLIGRVQGPRARNIHGHIVVKRRRESYNSVVAGTVGLLASSGVAVAQLISNPTAATLVIILFTAFALAALTYFLTKR